MREKEALKIKKIFYFENDRNLILLNFDSKYRIVRLEYYITLL